MKELHEVMAPYVARLRKLGVTGDIMILPTVNDAVTKTGFHDPRESFSRWNIWANAKLISAKPTWAEVEKDVAAIVSGERKKAIERGKNANGNGG